VLVEHPDEQTGLAIASGLRFAGYAVGVCPGPRGHGQCPLTGPAGCAPAHDADIVVCSLGYQHAVAREVLRELHVRYPDTPLVVEVPSETDAELDELLDGCHRLPAPATPEQILAAVQSLSGPGADEGLTIA
jgi:DNA-binding NarL/FixJ family response regulator